MVVVLISPNERSYLTNAGDREPLPIEYLSASLQANGIETMLYDLNHTNLKYTMNTINRMQPQFVGLSLPSTPSLPSMLEIGKVLVKNHRVVVGGKGTTSHEQYLNDLGFDVIMGDGEEAILDIAKGQRGILAKPIDVDKYPIPDRLGLVYNHYTMQVQGKRTAPIVSSRGCPHACIFCGNMAKRPKYRSIDNVVQELKQIRSSGYSNVYFYDENLLSDKSRAKKITSTCKDLGLTYRIEARANNIDEDIAQHLKDTGCILVAVGVESADNKVLKAMKKGETLEQITQGLEKLYDARVDAKGYFIIGLPEQDETSARKSIVYAKDLIKRGVLKQADFYALTPFPGSPIGDNPEKFGVHVKHKEYDKYLVAGKDEIEPVIFTDWLSSEQIKQLIGEAHG